MNSDGILTDIPVTFNSTNVTAIAKANVNPNKSFLVAAKDKDVVLWKIFSAPIKIW